MLDLAQLRKDPETVAARLRHAAIRSMSPRSTRSRPSARRCRCAPRNCRRGAMRCRSRSAAKGRARMRRPCWPKSRRCPSRRLARRRTTGGSRPALPALLLNVPNLPHESVPAGHVSRRQRRSAALGPEARSKPFDFAPRDHVDVGAPLGLDFETAAKLSGSRFTVMKGPIARLHRALAQFMLDVQTERARLHRVLHAVHRQCETAARHRPVAEVRGRICSRRKRAGRRAKAKSLYLIPTSEVPLTNIVRDRIAQGGRSAD